MSFLWRKSHNVTILVYHLVCPAKYRRVVFDDAVEDVLGAICQEIALRHEIVFLEIGADDDHADAKQSECITSYIEDDLSTCSSGIYQLARFLFTTYCQMTKIDSN